MIQKKQIAVIGFLLWTFLIGIVWGLARPQTFNDDLLAAEGSDILEEIKSLETTEADPVEALQIELGGPFSLESHRTPHRASLSER